jgi:hypothetical protein
MKKLFSLIIAPIAGFALWSATAIAGPNSLLGVAIGHPQINFTPSSTTQKAIYDGVNLTVSSTPIFTTFTSGGTSEFMISGALSLTAPIDAAGVITSGGTFSISGTVTDTATSASYSGVLLSGTVTDYGISDLGATDLADFRLVATGGSMKSLFDAGGSSVGMVVALEGSTYTGSFASSWSAARAKGDVGPIPDVVPQPPLTIGYWKNHPEAWPVANLTICGNSINQSDLIGVLSTPVRGDKTISMAHQLIAAMLNAATGNSCPGPIGDAANWLCSHGGIGGNRKDWDGGEELKNKLDTFNNGGGCP